MILAEGENYNEAAGETIRKQTRGNGEKEETSPGKKCRGVRINPAGVEEVVLR